MPRGGHKLTPERIRHMHSFIKRKPLAERYWEKVEKRGPDECWPWLGACDTVGYGVIWGGLGSPFKAKLPKAHRVGLHFAGKVIPEGMVADHKCGNRWCQNPAHMEPETQRDNCTILAHRKSPFVLNAAKVTCKHGHPFEGDNLARFLVRSKNGKRWVATRGCLTCTPSLRNHPRRFWLPSEVLR
jgi:hypothetical protein